MSGRMSWNWRDLKEGDRHSNDFWDQRPQAEPLRADGPPMVPTMSMPQPEQSFKVMLLGSVTSSAMEAYKSMKQVKPVADGKLARLSIHYRI